jgi:hypothetical protein
MSSQQAARHFAADIASDSSNCKHVFSPPRIFDDFTACGMRTNWMCCERFLFVEVILVWLGSYKKSWQGALRASV